MDIGTEKLDYGAQRFWDGLKQRLDEELTQDELKRALYLLPRHGIDTRMLPMLDSQDWSDLLIFLENNMLIEDALSILKHVFAVMDLHLEQEHKSLAQIIHDHEHAQRVYGCPNIIGREEEIIECFDKLKNSDCKGLWIHGVGGLGKTVLADEICSRFFIVHNVVIVKISLKQVKNPCEFVRAIMAMFTDYVSTSSDLSILTGELLFCLKGISKDTCILVDNIEDVYQFNEKEVLLTLLRFLDTPSYMPIKWIVTSRIAINFDVADPEQDIDGIKEVELFPLKREYAKHLLRLSCKPIQLTETQYQILLDMSGEIPLAIRLLSSAIIRHQSDWQCDRISDELLKPLLNQELHLMNDCIAYAYSSLKEVEQNDLKMISIVESSEFDVDTVKAILEIEDEKEVIFLMMSLTNRHIVQRVHTGRREVAMQSNYSTSLQYCLHPLVFHYLYNLQPDGYNIQTQNNFCKHVLQRIEPYIASIDSNYVEAIGAVSGNRSLLKVLFSVLSIRKIDDNHLLTTKRNMYLSKLHDLLHMTQPEKDHFYSGILKQSGNLHTYIFWKLEQIRMLTDGDNFVIAKSEIEDIENNAMNNLTDDEYSEYLKGRYWYIKGRYFRCKKDKQLHNAIECFTHSLRLYENTPYVPDAAMALNAIGNAYFDQRDFDNALKYHQEAAKLLREFIPDSNHPEIIIYDFNVGTIYLAKAKQECSINGCVKEEARRNFQKALDIFNDTMSRDVITGTSRMPQYAAKLAQRAHALFRLDRLSEAISDMKSSLDIKLAPYKSPDSNITAAYFRTGMMFIEWREQLSKGTDMTRQLLKEALKYFRQSENEVRSGDDSCLSGTDKSTFIAHYRKIAKEVKRDERRNITQFCTLYESGVLFNTTSSSSASSSPSMASSNSSSDRQADADDGIDIDDDNMSSGDAETDLGISYEDKEKREAIIFEQGFLSELKTQISDSDSKTTIDSKTTFQQKKRHRISSSDSD